MTRRSTRAAAMCLVVLFGGGRAIGSPPLGAQAAVVQAPPAAMIYSLDLENANRALRGLEDLPNGHPDKRMGLWEAANGNLAQMHAQDPHPAAPAPMAVSTWSGNGSKQTDVFSTPTNEWHVRWTHQGDGLFSIKVYDADGHYVTLLANLIGPSTDSSAVHTPPGRYYLSITGDAWTVSTGEASPPSLPPPPPPTFEMPPPSKPSALHTWTGKGKNKTATEMFSVPWPHWQVRWWHKGGGHFRLQVCDDKQHVLATLDHDGTGDGVEPIDAPPGRFYLIPTGNEWAVSVEPNGEPN